MKRVNLSLFCLIVLYHVSTTPGLIDPLTWIKSQVEPPSNGGGVYVTFGEDKQEQLVRLKKVKAELEEKDKEVDEHLSAELNQVGHQISLLKEKIKEHRGDDFLQKKLSILNELHQTLIDRQLAHKQEIASLDQQVNILEDYLKDPDFKGMDIGSKSFYSFENLQSIMQKIADQDDVINHLDEQKNSLSVELENRKKQLELLSRDLKGKEREQKEGIKPVSESLVDDQGFDIQQRSELLDLNIRLLASKKALSEQRIHEVKRRLSLFDTKIFVERAKRKVLNEQRVKVKDGLRVEESNVQKARANLERTRQEYLEKKDTLYEERKNYEKERESHKAALDAQAKKLGITLVNLSDLNDLAIEPSDAEGYLELSKLINYKESLIMIDKRMDFLDAQINLIDAEFDRAEIAVEFIESWHKLTMRKFRSESEVEAEINKYYEPGTQAEQEIAAFVEKRSNATNFLTAQNKVVESIRQRAKKLEAHRHLFKDPAKYMQARRALKGADELIQYQIATNRQIIEVYSKIIQLRSSIRHQISGIISELQSIGLRPPNAITWEGIKNVPFDFAMLWSEVGTLGSSYFKGFTVASSMARVKDLGLMGGFKAFVALLALLSLFFLLRMALPVASSTLLTISKETGNLYPVSRLGVALTNFLSTHFITLFIWTVVYGAISFDFITDIFPRVVFYFASIPYFIFLSNRFFVYMAAFNEKEEYLFVSKAAIDRLYGFVSVVLYATIAVFFFRQAYMLASYSKSELPTILLTTYSIIVRIMLISLIRKEDLLEIIPSQGTIWEWLRVQVEKHFYPIFLLLVALIVMSEPHVGYGKYVSYVLWGVVGTIILARIFVFFYLLVKRYSTVLFFKAEGEIQQERFTYAKSGYGLFVIVSFVVLAFFAAIIGARIWGYAITFQDVTDLLNTEIFSLHEGTTGRKEITVISLFQIVGFVFGSFVIASAIDTFVVRRVFDLLLLDQGVQYTISTIMHYLIVAIVIMIGFQRLGLSYVILVLVAPVLLGIGWSLRDYANDFVSYFIILVQRPFKIGDFVRFDGKITGVVRKITPRSIIIREKNSVNVLLPNSKVVNSQITNWNYTRSFTAFPDVYIAVPFSADPSEVRNLIMRVLDTNMNILKNPKPVVRLDDFSSNGYLFMVRGFLSSDNVLHMLDISSDVRFGLTRALRDNGIEITGPVLLHKQLD